MEVIIKLDVNDITTSKIGNNIMIKCENDLSIVLTPDAINELINDYQQILKQTDEIHKE